MRKIFAFPAVIAAFLSGGWCATAEAQSVTLYGVVDTGIEYVHNANPAGQSVVRMPVNTGELPSRWGVTGSELLGDGYKAIFTLESGFNMSNGVLDQGNRIFGRQAFVGIDSPYGTVTFGRQYSMLFWAMIPADVLGPDLYGSASFDAWLGNARSDSTVAYRKSLGGFTLGATYSFGRDASPTGGSNSPGQGTCAGGMAGNNEACREWSVMLKYDTANWGAAAAYDRQNGGEGALANLFNGLPPLSFAGSGNRDARIFLDGYVKISKFQFSALWINRHVTSSSALASTVTSNQLIFESSYQYSPTLIFDGLFQYIDNKQQDTRATMETVRGTYFLSKRTAVYAQAGFVQNSVKAAYTVSAGGVTTPGKGMNQIGTMVGVRHLF